MLTLKQIFNKLLKDVNEDNLVLNWANLYEDKYGNPVYAHQDKSEAARFCILGHVLKYNERQQMSLNQYNLFNSIRFKSRISFIKPHTPNQVKRIYKNWLKKLENTQHA